MEQGNIPSLDGEEWRDVPGYEGLYQVSNTGLIKTLTKKRWNGRGFMTINEKVLKTFKNRHGYFIIRLHNNRVLKTYKIHRLVSICFLKQVDGKTFVNHKDGNKENNHILNLEWCTSSENQLHAYSIGLKKPAMLGKKYIKNTK